MRKRKRQQVKGREGEIRSGRVVDKAEHEYENEGGQFDDLSACRV